MATIESEKEAEAEKKRQRIAQTQAGQAGMAMATGSSTPAEQGDGRVGDAQDMGRESGVQ